MHTLRWVWTVIAGLAVSGCFVSDAELLDALDRDGDGFQPVVAGGPDCAEGLASVNPDAAEVCGDGIDNDCDGFIDDDGVGARIWYRDDDGDGFGIVEEVSACTEPQGYAPFPGDCNDSDPAFNPAVDDLCDGLDQDCDGVADDEVPLIERYRDADGDGFGSTTETLLSCQEEPGFVNQSGDCDDGNSAVNPAAEDFCDGQDQNCNGLIDESAAFTVQYRDSDGDGFGSPDETIEACEAVAGFASNSQDCDDTAAGVNPLAEDLCDGVDQDCDSFVDDDAEFITYFADADGDGVGHPGQSVQVCGPAPTGYVAVSGDCDDLNADLLAFPWYRDADGDGVGSELTFACEAPDGFVANDGDCDDSNPNVLPGRDEICKNGIDDDCDPSTDCRLRGLYDTSFVGLPYAPMADGAIHLSILADYFGDEVPEGVLMMDDGTFRLVDLSALEFEQPLLDLGSRRPVLGSADLDDDGRVELVTYSSTDVEVWSGGSDPPSLMASIGGFTDVKGAAAMADSWGSGVWVSDRALNSTLFVDAESLPTGNGPIAAAISVPTWGASLGHSECQSPVGVATCSVFATADRVFGVGSPSSSVQPLFDLESGDAALGDDWIPLVGDGDGDGLVEVVLLADPVSGEGIRFAPPLATTSGIYTEGSPSVFGADDDWVLSQFDSDSDGCHDHFRSSGVGLSVRYSGSDGSPDFTIIGSSLGGNIVSGVDIDLDGYDDFLVVRPSPIVESNVVVVVYGSGP